MRIRANALAYKRYGNVNVLSGAIRRSGSATTSATTVAPVEITNPDYVPPVDMSVFVPTTTGQQIRVIVRSNGQIMFAKVPTASFSFATGEYLILLVTWIT